MAIRTVVTRGFGNGTFNGTIPLVVTRGYAIASAVVLSAEGYKAIAVRYRADKAVAVAFRNDKAVRVPYRNKNAVKGDIN